MGAGWRGVKPVKGPKGKEGCNVMICKKYTFEGRLGGAVG